MKSFVYIALVVFLGTVAVQGYGPKINRKRPGGPHKPPHRPHGEDSHGPHHGPPERPHHPGPPHHWPSHDRSGPRNQHGWDDSPIWDDGPDSGSSSYGSYGPDDSSSPEDSYGHFDYSRGRDSDSSYGDSDDWHDHHRPKHPCKHPHTKKPPKPTRKPVPPTPKPIPPTPKPIPTTPKPIPTAPTPHKVPFPIPTLPPNPDHTRFTPRPTTPSGRPDPTTPTYPSSTRTVGPDPWSPITTAPTPTWHPTPPTQDTTHWETTPNSNPDIETTTTIQEAFPTLSPETQACIDLCLSTPEYNPVCGSNGQTYDNEGKLFCAASCGVNVTLRRRSVCPPPNFDYDDNGSETTGTATPPPPITTTEPYVGRTTALTSFQRCMRQCPITASFTPVCGSDLVTYMNMDRLKCARSCGEVLEVLCEKPCAACGFNPVTVKTTTTLRTTTTPQIGRSTQEPDIQECIKGCPVTPEYNPICGSNRVTYNNPGHLVCAQLCGVAVSVSRMGPCGPATTSTTTRGPRTTRSPGVLSCIRRCPVTSEYNPVCGSDGLTYTNIGNMHCAKFCGVEVDFKHKYRCVDGVDDLDDGTDESTTSQTTQDINKDKDPAITPSWRSTTSSTTLFTSPTTTEKPTSPVTTPTSTKNPGPSTTLGFSIPDDVLVDIFGSTTSKPTNPDEDEDLDLDPRFGNDKDTN